MSEAFLRAWHAPRRGITSSVLARGGSYVRLADRVVAASRDLASRDLVASDGPRVLDLGCDDGYLVDLLRARGCAATGIDLARGDVIARAQQLPFADHAFAAVTSHLSFMLFDDIERVVAEIDRVLAPGGTFSAVLGGGPTADGHDAFHRFLEIAKPRGRALGDPRARSEAGWRALFAGSRGGGDWRVVFERWEVDLSGPFDVVWEFFAASYDDFDRDAVRAAMHTVELACRVVLFLATATR